MSHHVGSSQIIYMQFIGSYIDFLEQTDNIVMSVFYQLVVALLPQVTGTSQTALQG